jgi:hypothetical protein
VRVSHNCVLLCLRFSFGGTLAARLICVRVLEAGADIVMLDNLDPSAFIVDATALKASEGTK